MDTTNLCPSCAKPLAPNAPKGLCPECLMQAAFPTGTQGGDPAGDFVPPKPEEIAPHFPQLEILECLGRGGMGVVYKARQKTLNRFVALKLLAPEKVKDAPFAERFLREAQALARLNHPNIVTVYDFGESGGLYFLLMEFMDGLNLRQLLRARQIPAAEALAIVPRICEALQYAHDQGIVHRDIKPENILLDTQGRVKIADFGIAKLLGQASTATLTQEEQIIGTPHYMAPEQTEKPQSVDHRADIYSLGVVFYEMLTGELPLGKFQPPSQKVQIDVRLDEVVLRALEKEPERRFQTARVLKTQVDTIVATPPVASKAASKDVYAPEPIPHRKINWIPALVFYVLADVVWLGATLVAAASHKSAALGVYLVGLPFWFSSTLLWAILHHACWKALPPKYRSTTPACAVGFMFIPLFNWYWAFVSYPQLAEGYNELRKERPELALKDVKGPGIAAAVVFVLAWSVVWFIDYTPFVVALADMILFVLFYHGIVTNANLVIESARGGNVQGSSGWPASAVGALVMTVVSVPVGAGALIWLIGIFADSSWHPSAQEMIFTIALFGIALAAMAGCVSFGVLALRQLRQSSSSSPGRSAALTALWVWPVMLALAVLAFLGYSRWLKQQKMHAERARVELVAKQEKVLAALPGGGKGVPVGAVVDRTVNEFDSGKGEEALCLRTGRLVSFGAADLSKPDDFAAWCQTNRADVMVGLTRKRWSLMTSEKSGLKFSDFSNDQWETAKAEAVTEALTRESAIQTTRNGFLTAVTLPKNPGLPVTFVFRSHDGAEGLMQVAGIDNDASTVRFRYKFTKLGVSKP